VGASRKYCCRPDQPQLLRPKAQTGSTSRPSPPRFRRSHLIRLSVRRQFQHRSGLPTRRRPLSCSFHLGFTGSRAQMIQSAAAKLLPRCSRSRSGVVPRRRASAFMCRCAGLVESPFLDGRQISRKGIRRVARADECSCVFPRLPAPAQND